MEGLLDLSPHCGCLVFNAASAGLACGYSIALSAPTATNAPSVSNHSESG